MPKFSTGTAKEPSKLEQYFSFTGKVRGADVLLRLVGVCGYDLIRQTLDLWEAAEVPGQIPNETVPDIPVLGRRKARKASND